MTDAVQPSADAVIVDRGYRTYEGSRTGAVGITRAIVNDGFRRVVGLRRKARRKVLPWFFIILALASVVILIGIHWATSNTPAGDIAGLPLYGEYFDFISVVALLFAAMAIPELFVPDRTQGTLNVYFSRPLTVDRYLGAKALAMGAIVLSFYLIPQLIFHIGLAAVSDDGFLSYLGANLDILWKVPAAALVYLAVHGSVAAAVSAFLPRVGAAAGVFLGAMFIFNLIAQFFLDATEFPGGRFASLFAFEQHPRYVRDWIFDINTINHIPEQAGFEPIHSLAVAFALVVVSTVVVRWQYKRIA